MLLYYIMKGHLYFLIAIIINVTSSKHEKDLKTTRSHGARHSTTKVNPYTKRICVDVEQRIKVKHKSCFLRPDTGPCRADIIQYYYDAKAGTCYRFFWGGCQGNGNRFESGQECFDKCHINITSPERRLPHFCSMAFDYGTCFGHFPRWTWDKFSKSCKNRLYSGCGGNQNNFETRDECYATCLTPPIDTLNKYNHYTTCIPYIIEGVH